MLLVALDMREVTIMEHFLLTLLCQLLQVPAPLAVVLALLGELLSCRDFKEAKLYAENLEEWAVLQRKRLLHGYLLLS